MNRLVAVEQDGLPAFVFPDRIATLVEPAEAVKRLAIVVVGVVDINVDYQHVVFDNRGQAIEGQVPGCANFDLGFDGFRSGSCAQRKGAIRSAEKMRLLIDFSNCSLLEHLPLRVATEGSARGVIW